jgi:hypothetical protein
MLSINLHLHEATSIFSRPELSLFLLTSAKSAAPLAPASFFLCDEQIHAKPVSVSFAAALLATSADGDRIRSMCGRYQRRSDKQRIAEDFAVGNVDNDPRWLL